jgi:hypothetical protein
MFTVKRQVGRLFEARISRLAGAADVAGYAAAFGSLLGQVEQPVLCADHRPVAIYAPPVANALAELFNDMNKRWARVAIVVASTNATLAMQLQRIVRESRNPSRRVFFEAEEARVFLGEVLDVAEIARLRTFLGEHPASGPGASGRP